ncbi:putative holin-like toxin [Streptococcus suis]
MSVYEAIELMINFGIFYWLF